MGQGSPLNPMRGREGRKGGQSIHSMVIALCWPGKVQFVRFSQGRGCLSGRMSTPIVLKSGVRNAARCNYSSTWTIVELSQRRRRKKSGGTVALGSSLGREIDDTLSISSQQGGWSAKTAAFLSHKFWGEEKILANLRLELLSIGSLLMIQKH